MRKQRESFEDILPIIRGKETKRRSRATIEHLSLLRFQLMEFATNKEQPKKNNPMDQLIINYCQPIVNSAYFKWIGIIGLLMNHFILFAETNKRFYSFHHSLIIFFEIVSYLILFFGFVLTLLTQGKRFINEFWCYIDIICIFVTPLYYFLTDKFPTNIELIFTLKILRLLPILRSIKFYRSSAHLFRSIMKSLPNLSLTSYFILFFISVSAFVATSIFKEGSIKWFHSIRNSMYAVFVLLSQSGWLDSYWKAEEKFPNMAKIFYILIGFFGSFVLVNIFTGISSISMNKAKQYEEKEKTHNKLIKNNEKEKVKRLNTLLQRKRSLEKIEKFKNIDLTDLISVHKEMETRLQRLHSLYRSLDRLSEKVFEENKKQQINESDLPSTFSDDDDSETF